MKFLELFSSETTYKVGVFVMKISGFIFFTVKRNASGIKYYQSFLDYSIFLVSILFSLSMFVLDNTHKLNIEIKSSILDIGTVMLLKISLVSILATKLINIFGSRKVFSILKNFERIDKKVCC